MRPPRSPASICPYSCSGRGMTASFHRRQPGGFSGLSPPLSYRKSMGRTSCCRRAPPSAPPSCCISSVGSRSPSNKSLRGSRGPEVGVRGMPSPFINLDERGRHTPHPNLLPLVPMRKDFLDGVLRFETMWAMPSSILDVRLDTSLELLLERAPAAEGSRVLATVVATAGSTHRKPGARMLIMADGSYLGLLSVGCLEADLKLHAQQVLENGVPRAVEYDMRGPDDVLFGIGAGCEGAMRVLLEPAGPRSRAAAALETAGRTTRTAQ